MAAYRGFAAIVPGTDRAKRLLGTTVTHDFFDVLQASPFLGRGFLLEEDRPGQDPVVILSHRLWRDRFGSQSDAIGDVMIMNGVSYTVVGVMPPTFDFPFDASFLTPLAADVNQWGRGGHGLVVIARLGDRVALETARADLHAIALRLGEAYPHSNDGHYNVVYSLQSELTRGVRPALWMLFATVGVVLLIVSANIANMQFAKAVGRRREMTIRTTLGATRGRVLRQLLTESLFLAFVTAAGGTVVTILIVRAASAWSLANAPWIAGVHV